MEKVGLDYIELTDGTGSLLLEMPHSGMVGLDDPSMIPALMASNLRTSKAVQDTVNFGCDHAVPLMTGFDRYKKDPRTSTLQNHLARALTDPNRDETEVSGHALEGRPTDVSNSGVLMARTVPNGIDFSDRASMEETARAQMEPIGRDVARDALASEPHTVLPDVVLIHNGFASCLRDRIELIKAAFEKAGLLVSHGTGPLTGNNGVTALYGDPAAGTHVVGIEHVTHGIETDRLRGGLTLAEKEAEALQAVYADVFEAVLAEF